MSKDEKMTRILKERKQHKTDLTNNKNPSLTQEGLNDMQVNTHRNWCHQAGATYSTHYVVKQTIAKLKEFITTYYIDIIPTASNDQKFPATDMRAADRYCGFKRVNEVYQRALENNTLVTPHTEDSFWLCVSLTNGDCGVFAIALHLALKAQGIESDILIDDGDNHAALFVADRVYDAINFADTEIAVSSEGAPTTYSVKEGAHLESVYQAEDLTQACARWIPYDNIGWGICHYFQQCYTTNTVELKVPCEPTTPLDHVDLKKINQVANGLVTKYKAV